jgi:hypothetical protein
MKMLRKLEPLIYIAAFFAITYVYFSPLFQGKTLPQSDITQWKYMNQDAVDEKERSGETPLWNSRMFGGMPAYQITGVKYYSPLRTLMLFNQYPSPANRILYGLIGAFIMFLCFGLNSRLAFVGSLVYAFSTYNLILLEAGHVTKANAIGLAPLVIGGVALLWRKKYILGLGVTGLGMGLQVFANHLQITYYLGIIIIAWFITKFVMAIKEKTLAEFFKVASLAAVGALLGIGANSVNLLLTQEYMKETIRGKSELTITPDKSEKEEISGGLDRDYAFQWSQGLEDLPTFIIPNFAGGGSSTYFGTKSNTYEALKRQGNPQARQIAERYPLAYWGSLPFTSGPEYYGAIIMFLFVMGFYISKGKEKWMFLVLFVLSMFMSMGKNFGLLNNLLFDYLPLYNKFRSVNMSLVIAQIITPLFAILTLHKLLKGKLSAEVIKHGALRSLYITGGFCVFVLIAAGMFDPSSSSDEQLGALVDDVKADRIALMRMDAFRSLVFIGVAFGLIWFWLREKISAQTLFWVLAVAAVVDLWAVDKRYLNNKNFVRSQAYEQNFQPNNADLQILEDTTNFRVFDGTVNAFNNARVCYFHRSVGGYHAAKLRRFQDVIEFHIMNNNMRIMNMLNAKYIIQTSGENGPPVANLNPNALGSVWLVDQYRMVDNPDQEILALKDFEPAREAIIDRRYADQLKGLEIAEDSNARIDLTFFSSDTLRYEYNTSSEQLAVFSEIYYNSNKGWQAYIDGEKVDHFRCNYILRGMRIPQGKGEITFIFEPQSYEVGKQIAGITSYAVYVLLIAGILWNLRFLVKRKESKTE